MVYEDRFFALVEFNNILSELSYAEHDMLDNIENYKFVLT